VRGQFKNKRDYNEPQIVDALQKHGFSVYRLDQPVDLVIGKGGRTWLAEVKMEGKQLNANQRKFYEAWRGNKLVLRSIEDVAEFAANVMENMQ
jgi:Holliday junction resolvase